MDKDSRPLAGIRVVDLSRVLAGPYCASLLGMLGAEVIKVEDSSGDEARQWPPNDRELGTPFLAMNLNKRGMVVDLKSEAGQQVVKDLVQKADVLVENFKTGTMERFGLDYETLKEINPRLVFVSVSAFGRKGPRANDLGYEAVLQAYSGPMSITGTPEGEPVRSGVSFLDMSTGITSALGAVTALFQRNMTGEGAKVDSSLLQTALGLMSYQVANYMLDGLVPGKLGSAHPMVVPYQAFPTADGHIFIASGNQNLFERLCRALGREDIVSDPRFVNNAARVKHREALLEILFSEFLSHTTDDLLASLNQAGVPCTRVNNVEELIQDGHVDELGALVSAEDPVYGELRLVGLPFFLNEQNTKIKRSAPRLGEHTREILREIGYEEQHIDDLFAQKVVDGH